eukprot:5337580-Amphidinium_carterae.3
MGKESQTSPFVQRERFWCSLWSQHQLPAPPLLATPTPEIDLHALQEVVRQHPKKKTLGGDGWHPRSWSLLPLAYQVHLKLVLELWEKRCFSPDSLDTLIAFIPKPNSAEVRPNAKTASLMGTWSKLRRSEADAWEHRFCYPLTGQAKIRAATELCGNTRSESKRRVHLVAHPAAASLDCAHSHHKLVVGRWNACVWRQESPILWASFAGAAFALQKAYGSWNAVTSVAGAFLLVCCRLG